MKKDNYEVLIAIVIGISWFVVLFGASWSYFHFNQSSLVGIVASIVFGTVPGLFLLIFSYSSSTKFEILKESKKQTKILENINDKITNN